MFPFGCPVGSWEFSQNHNFFQRKPSFKRIEDGGRHASNNFKNGSAFNEIYRLKAGMPLGSKYEHWNLPRWYIPIKQFFTLLRCPKSHWMAPNLVSLDMRLRSLFDADRRSPIPTFYDRRATDLHAVTQLIYITVTPRNPYDDTVYKSKKKSNLTNMK